MTSRRWRQIGPALLVGLGIVVATLVADLADGFGWWVMAAPVLLALCVVCADLLEARLRDQPLVPSLEAWILAGVLPVAGLVVTLRDPASVASLIPIFGGAACWVPVASRSGSDRGVCP